MARTLPSVAALCFFVTLLAAPSVAQSGKISGRVTDASTGEPIPGANVIVSESAQGDASDLDGYYTILNVSPGTVTLEVSSLGYATLTIEGVDVNIGQTSTVDAQLRAEDLGLGDVVVRAERPVVEKDVSNSRANVSAAEIEALPASDIGAVVGLQAGITGDFNIRGSGGDEISFQVNGLTLRDERNNTPFTSIPLSSVQEVQVQTGGFNAEYGNVRSGVVNVVTKEGDENRYEADVQTRISPATQKNFGILANDRDSYWIRPYVDDEVAWTGTDNGAWSPATQQQYVGFEGWVAVSQSLLEDDDPTNDLTPEALQQAFLWQHRKSFEITDPDYDLDLGFGGPVPGARALGNLRFYASYRREEDMYLLPLNTDRYQEQTGRLKLTSNVATGMKLSLEGMLAGQDGTGASRTGQPGFFRTPGGIAGALNSVSFIDSRIFSTDYWGPSEVSRNQIGGTFSHSLSSSSFYEIRANRYETRYDTNPGRRRDETPIVTIGGVGFNEAPFGWQPYPSNGVNGLRMGVGMSNARDSTVVTNYNLRGDLTSQINRFMEVKTGLEFNLTDSDVSYAQIDSFLTGSNQWSQWDRNPVRGAGYAQTKLEFQGMIANLGLRADYYAPGGEWYDFSRFDPVLAGVPTVNGDPRPGLDSLLATTSIESQLTLSPRLGVSFPVTSVSKLYFNYGHFRALPDSDDLYLIRAFANTGQVSRVANPNAPLPKTIAYELGYEQSFFEQFLVRVAGYYKDVSLQPRLVTYQSRSGATNYSISEPNSFEDIRGFELTLTRNRGEWIRGFVNYTYMVYSDGYFGFPTIFENTTVQREQETSDTARRNASSEPLPRPYGRFNVDVFTPDDFGLNFGGFRPLADWRISFLGRWRDGGKATWVDGGFSAPGIANNVDVTDDLSFDLRFSRTFDIGQRSVTFFADVFNALSRKQLSGAGFVDGADRVRYYESLHFPESANYSNIPGDDSVGDFRDPDVPFQPTCSVPSLTSTQTCAYGGFGEDVLYYDQASEGYFVYNDGTFSPADPGRVDEVLETKAYIDMPNQGFLTFLNPRDVFFGLRVKL